MRLIPKVLEKIGKGEHLGDLLKGSSISFLFRLGGLGLAYIFALLVARTLGAESWGIYSLCLAVVTLLGIVGRLGFDTALLRFNAQLKAQKNYGLLKVYNRFSYKIVFASSLVLTILMYFSATFIAEYIFHKPNLVEYFRIASLAVLPISFSAINARALRGLKKITKSVFLDYMAQYLYIILAFVGAYLWLNDFSTKSFIWLFVAVSYIYFFQGLFWQEKEIRHYNAIVPEKKRNIRLC